MKRIFRVLRVLVMIYFTMFVNRAYAIPNTINISGYIEDTNRTPIDGTFDFQVKFYTTETTTSFLCDISSTTAVISGVFAIPITLPSALLTLDDVWYSLAIDTNRDGLNDQDLFNGRFQITAVPYALSGKPAPFFSTHPPLGVQNGLFAPPEYSTYLHVSPFVTPPGGVEFSKMSTKIRLTTLPTSDSLICSFGIYDTSGTVVVSSGPIVIKETGIHIIQVKAMGKLEPSKLYYTGVGCNYGDHFLVDRSPGAPVPGEGLIANVVSNGMIPESFNPNTIKEYPSIFVIPTGISITLRN
ncbi:MAG: hypothetical protein ABFD69_06330 [Candidatus Sumerlaeia bacterium]